MGRMKEALDSIEKSIGVEEVAPIPFDSQLTIELVENVAAIVADTGHKEPENIRPPTAEESAAMQAAMTTPPVQVNPAEDAARKFTQLLPYVKQLASNTVGQKGLVRVLHAFIEFPLGAQKPRLMDNAERQLFVLLQELNGAKSVVLQEIIKNNALAQQVQAQTTEGNVDGSTENN